MRLFAMRARRRAASARERGGIGARRATRLVPSAVCAAVLGGALIAGTPIALGEAQTARIPMVMPPAADQSPRSGAPSGVSAMHASVSGVDRLAGPYGQGAAEVWLVLPDAPLRSVVVFGHGWKLTPPSPGHPWVDQFRPWLDHLAAAGNAVMFPAYQGSGADAGDATRVQDFAAAIQTGYIHLGRPQVPFVAVGYSFGASLALYYGANAGAWGLPVPRAVQAIFPAGMIRGAPLPRLSPSVRVLIQVGDADTEAGRGGADAFWSWLSGHPTSLKRYEVIHSSRGLLATHAAPKSTSPAAKLAFWAPLDRLITLARGGAP